MDAAREHARGPGTEDPASAPGGEDAPCGALCRQLIASVTALLARERGDGGDVLAGGLYAIQRRLGDLDRTLTGHAEASQELARSLSFTGQVAERAFAAGVAAGITAGVAEGEKRERARWTSPRAGPGRPLRIVPPAGPGATAGASP